MPASAQQQQFGLYFCLFLHYTRSDKICKKRSGDKQNHSGMMLHKTRHQNRRALWWPEVFGKSLMGDLWHALGHPGESWGALGRLGGVSRRPWGALGAPWGDLGRPSGPLRAPIGPHRVPIGLRRAPIGPHRDPIGPP